MNLSTKSASNTILIEKTNGNDVLGLTRKIDSITKSLSKPYFNKILKDLVTTNLENAEIIVDYILAEQTELNIKDSTKEGKIKILVWLSNFHKDKTFKEMTKQDIIDYLNNLRKSSSEDPTNKWIGSYNGRQIVLLKFFKWLYNPEEDFKKRHTPTCMQGVRKLPRKEKTSYKPSDLWEAKEHSIFLKYCPFKRDRCYHALANDMSARPSEILNLKVKDIHFSVTEEGMHYAEVRITQGKTGPRTVPLIDSLPYLKEWLDEHPMGNSSDSFIFVSLGNNYGSKLSLEGLSSHYEYYKSKYFPKLLGDDSVTEYEKALIRNMITKPWNLYVYRHSALTEKSLILSESALKDHAGWTMSSKMTQVYIHLSGESSKVLLQKRGVFKKNDFTDSEILKSKQCPSCNEPNKRDSKFCNKCRMVLNYDAYAETLEVQKRKEEQIKRLEEKYENGMKQMKEDIENKLQQIITKIDMTKI